MKTPISILIMDVTNSTGFTDTKELTNYLGQVVDWIDMWTRGIVSTKVKKRYGDEIIVVTENYFTAYLLAFYIILFWKYEKHPPYLGITFGMTEDDVLDIDLEEWNDPLVKSARIASETIKQSKRRPPILFHRLNSENDTEYPMVSVLNILSEMQFKLIREQSPYQHAVFKLYLLYQKQVDIANRISRKPATISKQLKDGNSETIIDALDTIERMLNRAQTAGVGIKPNSIAKKTDVLKKKIRNSLLSDIPFELD
ncbi:hypothetical protein CBW65_11445 [Tumebacillus avium]|uniref:Uncharacterized protein n=1 Tax=Tumebacillus avium TaxID=1903704 RepID=A0A1Y0INZ5_9BACL|nr:hypothetical protein [Tumebacillus avium]ARU61556.1 hypothetical protein CBW65_11445 [Tumebacillus avium]